MDGVVPGTSAAGRGGGGRGPRPAQEAPPEAPTLSADARAFRRDLERFYRIHFGTPRPALRDRLRLWATHSGLHCVAGYRLSRCARHLGTRSRWLRAPLVNLARTIEIGMEVVQRVSISAEIGPGFYVGHAGMIFIGPTRIGRDFSVTHAVTIGVGQTEGAKGTPVVGDRVWVGTASVLAGAIRVGDGVTVANGTMLSRSVPDGALVAGNPGRVVMIRYDNARLMGEQPGREAPPEVDRDERAAPAPASALAR
jgi:serine acetyltransferase